MRSTLTLEDDIAAALERLRRARGVAFKALVNEALREGLKQMRARPTRGAAFRTRAVDLGAARIGRFDNIGDTLAISEGEAFA